MQCSIASNVKALLAGETGVYDQVMLVLQLLAEACNSVCEHLYDFLTNRYATHVARRLLCIIAGRNVLPLAAKSQNKVCACACAT